MGTVACISFILGLAIGTIVAITAICIYGNAFERSMRALGDSTAKFIQRKSDLINKAKQDSNESND